MEQATLRLYTVLTVRFILIPIMGYNGVITEQLQDGVSYGWNGL